MGKHVNHDRLMRLRTTHAATRKVLHPLGEVSVRGFDCADFDGSKYRCHCVMSSTVIDILEGKDFLGVRHGRNTEIPCFKCTVHKGDLGSLDFFELRTLDATVLNLVAYQKCKEKADTVRFIEDER